MFGSSRKLPRTRQPGPLGATSSWCRTHQHTCLAAFSVSGAWVCSGCKVMVDHASMRFGARIQQMLISMCYIILVN